MAFGNGPRVVTDGLVLALDAADKNSYPGSGTTWNNLIFNTPFTLTNGPTFSNNNGGSFVYDGTDDTSIYSSAPPSSWDVSTDGAFSFGGWIKTNTTAGFQQYIRISNFFFYFYTPVNIIRIYYTGANSIDFTVNFNHDQWVYWFASVNRPSDTIVIYKNGVQENISTAATATGVIGTGASSIGDETIGGEQLKGTIGSIQYYTKALSASEVLQNYNAQKSRFGL
jgi:hypothetical protein